jgi:hypothetical protein
MRVHRQREITMNQKDLADTYVVVHELSVGRQEKHLARGTLIIAENFHHDWGALGTKGFVRIDVVHTVDGLSCRRLPPSVTRFPHAF